MNTVISTLLLMSHLKASEVENLELKYIVSKKIIGGEPA